MLEEGDKGLREIYLSLCSLVACGGSLGHSAVTEHSRTFTTQAANVTLPFLVTRKPVRSAVPG